jgi:hypothetical protein
MNAIQRKIVMWTLIASAVALHFSFLNWTSIDDHLQLLGGLVAINESFRDQRVLCILAGLVAPALLIGTGLFIGAGRQATKPLPPRTNPETSKTDP